MPLGGRCGGGALDLEVRLPDERLTTRLARPGQATAALLTGLAHACHRAMPHDDWLEEPAALLYVELLGDQRRLAVAIDRPDGVKRSTREELTRRVAVATAFMHDTYSQRSLGLATIAREACLSRFHLVRVFKAIPGITPMQHLTQIRLDAACRLAADGDAPVASFVTDTGFTDRTALFRQFRRRFGLAPTAYRASDRRGADD